MFKFEKSIFINRPQQEMFDYVNDPANNAQWQSGVELSEWTSESPYGVGSTMKMVRSMLGRKTESTIEVTKWDPPKQSGNKTVSGPVPVEVTTTFEAQEDGTLLTITGQAEFGGFFKMAEGLVGKQVEKQIESDLAALKQILEAS